MEKAIKKYFPVFALPTLVALYLLRKSATIKKNFREKEKEEGRNTMKFTYPAVFHKTEQGTYEGYFPDLACCYAKGDTLDEALEDAIHSAYDWISLELTEEEPDFPPVSDVADLGKSEGEIARNIAVNIRLFEGWDE